MPETPLKNQIINWLKQQDYWFQYSGNCLLEGEDVTDELVNATYKLFSEDCELKPKVGDRIEIIFNEIINTEANDASNLKLRLIKDIENVNALQTGQTIEINENLTVVYGANGSGKSGYIRLLNNAFVSRGDKNILHNVFKESTKGEPVCSFVFQSIGSPYNKVFPTDRQSSEFSQFAVFDTTCVRVLLENDNQLNFTPIGFEFFEKILQLFESVKQKAFVEIKANRPQNTFIPLFTNPSPIQEMVLNLVTLEDEEALIKIGTFTEEDAAELERLTAEIERLKALNIQKQIAELDKHRRELDEFMQRLQSILFCLTSEKITYYLSLIDDYYRLQTLSKEQGIKSLDEYNIGLVGSKEWREFIVSAKNYASAIEVSRIENQPYPSEKDFCILCLQPIQEKETILIKKYWQFLKSEAERELNRINQKIEGAKNELKGLLPVKFDNSTSLNSYLETIAHDLTKKWEAITSETEKVRQNLIKNLSGLNKDLTTKIFLENINEFQPILQRIQREIDELMAKNPDKEITPLIIRLNFLKDKLLLSKILEQVLFFVKSHKWSAKAEQVANSAFRTNSLTSFQGALFAEHITDNYTDTFNTECEILNAPKVVKIVQRNAKLSTLRKLQVAGQTANRVLSEGEQRAISLADFLTEVQLNPNNIGVIFDDPITSQDHYRREKIAERLVELAKQKQVIIFTHDIAFFVRLKIIAEACVLNHSITTIRNAGGTPGIISPNLPWIAQNVKARIGTLKDRLVRLKKIEKEESSDDYLLAAKSWYNLLREAWERAVEERLFKGVVERFLLGVQTQRLKKIAITSELLADIEKGMTDSSNWLHDSAAGLNPTPPDTGEAEQDLKFFEDFAAKCIAG